jgi:hypothetical protein
MVMVRNFDVMSDTYQVVEIFASGDHAQVTGLHNYKFIFSASLYTGGSI